MATVRIHKYDNMKGIAIFLIVLGHMLFVTKYTSVKWLHDIIYIIHLPIFFFVAGYFSKIGPDEPIKAFKRLIIPFIIFNIIYHVFCIVAGIPDKGILFFDTAFALWFLSALFMMKIALPIYDKLKYPIIIAFLIALLIGFLDFRSYFGFSRFIVFTPAFLIGFYYKDIKANIQKNYQQISNILNNKIVQIIIALVVVMACAFSALYMPFKVISLTSAYRDNFDMILRAIVLILGIAFTLVLTSFVSNNESFITKIGRNSMAVYVLHVYFIKLIQQNYDLLGISTGLAHLIFAFAVSAAIVLLLSRDIFTVCINKMCDILFNLLAKTENQ